MWFTPEALWTLMWEVWAWICPTSVSVCAVWVCCVLWQVVYPAAWWTWTGIWPVMGNMSVWTLCSMSCEGVYPVTECKPCSRVCCLYYYKCTLWQILCPEQGMPLCWCACVGYVLWQGWAQHVGATCCACVKRIIDTSFLPFQSAALSPLLADILASIPTSIMSVYS